MLDRRWLSNDGPLVNEFEEEICKFLGVRHCVAVANATIGLEIVARALNLTDRVIVPSYTFVATAHALSWLGITPVFADIDPATHNLDPKSVAKLITAETTGIMGVHLWGRPCDTEAIEKIAADWKIPVIYDSAHAFGCAHNGKMVGNFGACEVFSFHATKFINCFEGGAITTNDDELNARLRLMRNFGFAGLDNVVSEGTNGKMSEVCAAMGLTSLESMSEIVAANYQNYLAYKADLAEIAGVTLCDFEYSKQNNYQYIVVEVDAAVCGVSRDRLLDVLHAHNVIARKYFWPGCHRMEPYRTSQPNAGANLIETERVAERVIILPTGQTVSLETVSWVCQVIKLAISC